MLSPSQGFCCCLSVKLGALVVSSLACVGSAILAGVTFHSLAKMSIRVTIAQTAGFYLTSLSWSSLSLFSLIGFVSAILQHPLLLTIYARFVFYNIPANLLSNLFFTIVLFHFYRDANTLSKAPLCNPARGKANEAFCAASNSLLTLTWLYLSVLLPAAVAQAYIYVVIRRFVFVISGDWALKQHFASDHQSDKSQYHYRKRRTISHSARRSGRHKELRFTVEQPAPKTPAQATEAEWLAAQLQGLEPQREERGPRIPVEEALQEAQANELEAHLQMLDARFQEADALREAQARDAQALRDGQGREVQAQQQEPVQAQAPKTSERAQEKSERSFLPSMMLPPTAFQPSRTPIASQAPSRTPLASQTPPPLPIVPQTPSPIVSQTTPTVLRTPPRLPFVPGLPSSPRVRFTNSPSVEKDSLQSGLPPVLETDGNRSDADLSAPNSVTFAPLFTRPVKLEAPPPPPKQVDAKVNLKRMPSESETSMYSVESADIWWGPRASLRRSKR